jgi:hypothetical protein
VDEEDRSSRISEVFALLTAKLEDAATVAIECQGRRPEPELATRAQQITQLAFEAATIAGALATLLQSPGGERRA